ncbi:MAG: hypothetical protein AAFY67_18235 [Cyanobacteria bacterium J06642_9]
MAVLRCLLSACDAIDVFRKIYTKLSPPTGCRRLDVLAKRGLVHRIESLKTFVTCQYEESQQAFNYAIYDDCGKAYVDGCLPTLAFMS